MDHAGSLISGFDPPELREDARLLFKPPSLWCFVTAVPADQYSQGVENVGKPVVLWGVGNVPATRGRAVVETDMVPCSQGIRETY